MKQIKVGKEFALVDDKDFERVNQLTWSLVEWRGKKYAKRSISVHGIYSHIVSMHHFITGYDYTDHKDGNGLNNQRSNLRSVTHKKNIQLQQPQKRAKSSSYRGVYWFKPKAKWRARLKVDGVEVHIGYFDSENEAAKEWNKAALIYYGVDSFQNKIERKEVGQK